MPNISIFETKDEVGYANKTLRKRMYDTKNYLRILLINVSESELNMMDEVIHCDENKGITMLKQALDKNPHTLYMN